MSREELKSEVVKEKIKLYAEILRNLTIFLVAVGGGSVSLLYKLSNPISVPLLILGLTLTLGLIIGIAKLTINVKEALEELKVWEKKY